MLRWVAQPFEKQFGGRPVIPTRMISSALGIAGQRLFFRNALLKVEFLGDS
jgi:hypothetical protein